MNSELESRHSPPPPNGGSPVAFGAPSDGCPNENQKQAAVEEEEEKDHEALGLGQTCLKVNPTRALTGLPLCPSSCCPSSRVLFLLAAGLASSSTSDFTWPKSSRQTMRVEAWRVTPPKVCCSSNDGRPPSALPSFSLISLRSCTRSSASAERSRLSSTDYSHPVDHTELLIVFLDTPRRRLNLAEGAESFMVTLATQSLHNKL